MPKIGQKYVVWGKVYQWEPTFEFLEGTVIYSGHMKIMSYGVLLFFKFQSSWVLFPNKIEVLIYILWFVNYLGAINLIREFSK